jgi:hypothetical protein
MYRPVAQSPHHPVTPSLASPFQALRCPQGGSCAFASSVNASPSPPACARGQLVGGASGGGVWAGGSVAPAGPSVSRRRSLDSAPAIAFPKQSPPRRRVCASSARRSRSCLSSAHPDGRSDRLSRQRTARGCRSPSGSVGNELPLSRTLKAWIWKPSFPTDSTGQGWLWVRGSGRVADPPSFSSSVSRYNLLR